VETLTSGSKPEQPGQALWVPDELPPFPAVALKALQIVSGTDTSLRQLCDLIRTDPVFSAEILRIANSPLISISTRITSVLQASMLLGFQHLKNVVITVGLRAYLNNSYTPLLQACWRHSLACAMIAEKIAGASSIDKNFAYTAGVMHDIGRVALATLFPKVYATVVEREFERPEDVLHFERDLCGIDHCEAGRSVVAVWGLPEEFAEIVSRHHDSIGNARGATSVIQSSCTLADALGFAVTRHAAPRSYREIVAGYHERVRQCLPGDAEELASEIMREIHAVESV
jgi:putative nucleotidyltransferase with HDIG domain